MDAFLGEKIISIVNFRAYRRGGRSAKCSKASRRSHARIEVRVISAFSQLPYHVKIDLNFRYLAVVQLKGHPGLTASSRMCAPGGREALKQLETSSLLLKYHGGHSYLEQEI